MDNLGAGNAPHESPDQGSDPNRTRLKRSKYSSVNSRLDPNFDIKELVCRQVEENKSKNHLMDPKTMEFEKLVGLLHPTFILEYMQKILQYLTGNMVKMSFQNIAMYKEALLVRLCQEKSNLNCAKFDEATRKVAQQIIEVLEANENVFVWTCHYQKGILCSDVLVYEKVYTSKITQDTKDSGTNVAGFVPPLRTQNSNNANGDSNPQKKPTPSCSKIHLLNLLLKFMKDSTQLKLEYPVAPKSQASLLYSIIYQNKMDDMDIGFGFKCLYAPLYEALNVCKQIYDFNMTLTESSNDTMLMVLQKIPKGMKNSPTSTTQNSDGDHDTSFMSMSSDSSENLFQTKRMRSLMKLIPKVNEAFVKLSLMKVLEFVKDEARASLEFKCPVVKEYRFLKAIPKFTRDSDYRHLFTPECQALLRKIEDIRNDTACLLTTQVTVLERCPKVIRCLKFHKIVQLENTKKVSVGVPQHDHNTSVISISSDSSENSNPSKRMRATMKLIPQLKEAFVKITLTRILEFVKDEARASLEFTCLSVQEFRYLKLIPQCTGVSGYQQLFTPECQDLLRKIEVFCKDTDWKLTTEVFRMEKGSKGNKRRLVMYKSPDYNRNQKCKEVTVQVRNTKKVTAPQRKSPPTKGITFQAANAIEPTETIEQNATAATTAKATVNVDDAATSVAPNSRRSRLLAAMSVPVESDIGERLMRRMGWTGGALGARGEGITEPIMPALHISPGAGLGHVKQINATQSIYEFRVHLLNTLISFLRTRESETTLQYTNPLEKKKTRFVNYAIQAFKIRRGLALPNDNENRLVNIVIEELVQQGLKFEGFVSSDRRKISFKKVPSVQSSKVDAPRARAEKPDSNPNLRILTQSQSTPNVASSNASSEFISEHDVSMLSKHFELDELATPKTVKQLAYKLMCLTKIHNFVEKDHESREYRFDCVLNSKLQAFVSNVLMNVNRKAKANYGTDIENVIYNEIKRATPAGCTLIVVFGTQKFTLYKKVYQKRFTNSARGLPPPKSTDLKNTVIYQNNQIISCDALQNGSDDDDVIIIEKKVDIVEISDDEDKQITADSAKVDTAETSIDNLDTLDNDLRKTSSDKSIDTIIDITKERLDDCLIALNCSCNVSTSRETLSDMLENDYQRPETVDTELDNDIRVLEQAILDCDISDEEVMKPSKDETKNLVKPENNYKDADLEINNNHFSLISENKSNTNYCTEQGEEGPVEDNHIVDCSINIENFKDKSIDLNINVTNDHVIEINKDVINNGECPNNLQLSKENQVEKPPENVITLETANNSTQQSEEASDKDTEDCDINEQNSKVINIELSQPTKDRGLHLIEINTEVLRNGKCQNILELSKRNEAEEPPENVINSETANKSSQQSEEGSVKDTEDCDIIEQYSKDMGLKLFQRLKDSLLEVNKEVVSKGERENILQLSKENEGDKPPENVITLETANNTTQQSEVGSDKDTEDCDINEENLKNMRVKFLEVIKDSVDHLIEMNEKEINTDERQNILQLSEENEVEESLKNEINSLTINKSPGTIQKGTEDEKQDDEVESCVEKQTAQINANENTAKTDTEEDPKDNIPDKLQSGKENTSGEVVEIDLKTDYRDKSPGKRSRTVSATSESESSCKKCKCQIRTVRITCKDSEILNKNKVRKVQAFISESIDRTIDFVAFLPQLECHGVKNGKLIYSCHNDESLAWLTNLILASDLELNITETDYLKETYKMDIKIHSFDTVDKILSRIQLYNLELDTNVWRVIDKREFEDFVVVTVEIDRDSYDLVRKNNYSLLAGVDKAMFNEAWS